MNPLLLEPSNPQSSKMKPLLPRGWGRGKGGWVGFEETDMHVPVWDNEKVLQIGSGDGYLV